jgi:hypothetical protein
MPDGGPGVVQMVYTPYITWSPFTDTAVGSGSFTFAMQQTQFWTETATKSQQAQLGLITPPNDQTTNVRQYNQLMYTHTLPDTWSWLSVTVGQYTFAAFDSNQYAGNVQTSFISYPLAQNGTQTYPYGALGAYAQAASSDQQFTLAGGFQGATNVAGNALSTRGFATGKYAYFIIDRDGNMITGHARLAAAGELGWTEVPTLCLDHLTPAQARAFMIADTSFRAAIAGQTRLV